MIDGTHAFAANGWEIRCTRFERVIVFSLISLFPQELPREQEYHVLTCDTGQNATVNLHMQRLIFAVST